MRAFYTDEQVIEIARYLSSLDDYRSTFYLLPCEGFVLTLLCAEQTVDRIFEDLQEYSDFRIHQLCKDKEPLRKYLLNDGTFWLAFVRANTSGLPVSPSSFLQRNWNHVAKHCN